MTTTPDDVYHEAVAHEKIAIAAVMVREAVEARKGSLSELRARIWHLCEAIPVGVKLYDTYGPASPARGDGLIAVMAMVESEARQGPGWPSKTSKGKALIIGDLYIAGEDLDFWNGSNWHYAYGAIREANTERELRFMSGADTRAFARVLPVALARYIGECNAETAANQSELA